MADHKGKEFEVKFKQDFTSTIPNSTIDRLYDPVGGYVAISNISDVAAGFSVCAGVNKRSFSVFFQRINKFFG